MASPEKSGVTQQVQEEKFWIHSEISYTSGQDENGNYYYQLANWKNGEVYREYLTPVTIDTINIDFSKCSLHPHLHK